MTSDTNANGSSDHDPASGVLSSDADDLSKRDAPKRSGSVRDGSEQLYKIREILFGEQVTAQQARFEQLETRMSQGLSALRADLTRQIEAVEDRLLRKVDDVARRLETERDRREESMNSTAQSLRADIEHQTRSLQVSLENQIEAITHTLSQEANERKASADTERANLSALFANLSQQLQPAPEQNEHKETAS